MKRDSTKRGAVLWLAVAWLVLALVIAGTALADVQLRDVRLSADPDATRLVLDLSGRTTHRLFRLGKPDRLVVDLRSTSVARGVRAPAGDGVIGSVRLGPQPKRTLRLVLELKTPISARAKWARVEGTSGYRLTFDLRGGADLATAGASREATRAPMTAVRAAHAPSESGRDIVVAIDAGHGGEDPGAIGASGTREKDVVLEIARALARRIDREPGMRAVLTRDGDYFIVLRQRMGRARAAKADLFVSIHADSVRDREVSGASVYVLSEKGATNEAARWLAERENAADLKGGVKLDDKDNVLRSVLLDLSQTASIGASMEAAERVLNSIDHIGVVRKAKVQQAGFVVLKSPDIPSMLVETAYISNPRDERLLRAESHQQRLADAIFQGVRGYFEMSPPDGTRFAERKRAEGTVVLAGRASP